MIVERVLSVDQDRIDFGQLAVGTKAEVKTRLKGRTETPLSLPCIRKQCCTLWRCSM